MQDYQGFLESEKYHLIAFNLDPSEQNYTALSASYLSQGMNKKAENLLLRGLDKFKGSRGITNNLMLTYSRIGKSAERIILESKLYGLIEFNITNKLGNFKVRKENDNP